MTLSEVIDRASFSVDSKVAWEVNRLRVTSFDDVLYNDSEIKLLIHKFFTYTCALFLFLSLSTIVYIIKAINYKLVYFYRALLSLVKSKQISIFFNLANWGEPFERIKHLWCRCIKSVEASCTQLEIWKQKWKGFQCQKIKFYSRWNSQNTFLLTTQGRLQFKLFY